MPGRKTTPVGLMRTPIPPMTPAKDRRHGARNIGQQEAAVPHPVWKDHGGEGAQRSGAPARYAFTEHVAGGHEKRAQYAHHHPGQRDVGAEGREEQRQEQRQAGRAFRAGSAFLVGEAASLDEVDRTDEVVGLVRFQVAVQPSARPLAGREADDDGDYKEDRECESGFRSSGRDSGFCREERRFLNQVFSPAGIGIQAGTRPLPENPSS